MKRLKAAADGGVVIAAAIGLAGAISSPASASVAGWSEYTRPATYGVTTDQNVGIEMRDGVVLAANVQRPDAEGRFPVLVTQTPYGKDGLTGAVLGAGTSYFAQRGYAVVTVDVRGTGSSGGSWDSFGEAEQLDGPEVVAWAAKQPWSSGRVGLTGPSYLAITQLTTAAQRPKHLKAIFPVVPMGDGYRDIVFSGGQVNVSFIPLWLGLVTAAGLTPVAPGADPVASLATLAQHLSGAVEFQLQTVLNAAAGGDLAYDGPFWKTRSPLELVDRIDVPAFVVGGHHDLFQRGEPLIYERLRRHVPARLLMGPWTHVGGSGGEGLEGDGLPSLNEIQLRWFDRWLMGKRTRIGEIPDVTQFVYGPDRYRAQRDWPDPRLRPARLYMRRGRALGAEPPGNGEGAQDFIQHPLSGICTQSTVQWTAGLGEPIPCVQHNNVNENGEAVYSTQPMRRTLQLSGPAMARLWVRTTANDALLTVRVTDVAPNGRSTELSSGWLAGSFRAVDRSRSRYVDGRLIQPWHPFTRESVRTVTPGQPTPLSVEIFPMRAAIQEGHRLRVTVGPSDFPHQVPPLPQLTGSLLGQVEILTEPEHASYIELPGLRRGCPGGCRPLPTANLIRGD